jgi:hypothetical protein
MWPTWDPLKCILMFALTMPYLLGHETVTFTKDAFRLEGRVSVGFDMQILSYGTARELLVHGALHLQFQSSKSKRKFEVRN